MGVFCAILAVVAVVPALVQAKGEIEGVSQGGAMVYGHPFFSSGQASPRVDPLWLYSA